MSSVITSMPAMSRPTAAAAISHAVLLSGCISSVRSIDVPPVERFAVCRRATPPRPPPARCPASALRRQIALGLLVHRQVREDLRVADPAPRIAVGRLDQLAHRVRPVADHTCRHALRARHDLAVHDEHAVVASLDAKCSMTTRRLYVAARPRTRGATRPRRRCAARSRAHGSRRAASRSPGSRSPRPPRSRPRRCAPTSPRGTGRPMLPSTRFVSSLSCAISTAIELVRSVTRRLDAAQVPAQSELHERAVVQPAHRDAASTGLLDDRPRGRPEAHRLVQVAAGRRSSRRCRTGPAVDARAHEAGRRRACSRRRPPLPRRRRSPTTPPRRRTARRDRS